MPAIRASERVQAKLGLGLLAGVPVGTGAAALLLPPLGLAAGLAGFAGGVALPIILLLTPSLGLPRAVGLAAVASVVLAALAAFILFTACAATGCVG